MEGKSDTFKPLIGVTIGDPAGIGPEIVLKSLCNPKIHEVSRPVLIGDVRLLRNCAKKLGIVLEFCPISDVKEAKFIIRKADVIDVSVVAGTDIEIGKVSASAGKSAVAYIEKASQLALSHEIDGIATAPINKEAVKQAGYLPLGHTELFAQFTGSQNATTAFLMDDVKIFFVTRHMSLYDAIKALNKESIKETIIKANSAMLDLGYMDHRIAVAALNPHAGEGGLFGKEEMLYITPAVCEAQKMGINVTGPIGADSVFYLALEGRYDCVISLYHDQGHIASKTHDLYGTITITLGLPVIRTSVDHGTGLDIAWKGIANHKSMEKAIMKCAEMVKKTRLKERI